MTEEWFDKASVQRAMTEQPTLPLYPLVADKLKLHGNLTRSRVVAEELDNYIAEAAQASTTAISLAGAALDQAVLDAGTSGAQVLAALTLYAGVTSKLTAQMVQLSKLNTDIGERARNKRSNRRVVFYSPDNGRLDPKVIEVATANAT